ncbi:hypothetical protein DICPUDRAFT_52102 [Dictyostelium purpureum]|uniref:DNA mismatch repair protein MSH3 n=1 Tax=Dictyostelium purpureum TaxID=5786 RepID=F0Z6Z0_DICPU|nr:uncharacterized protein DICPUDRAFT_52102 [Dictyostelium purpureum]EGC40238.1 hypothetical protein DICPUDRAFT_52102 [Dictyostelium purpureum]|eukprot:XP_003283174.1 hypothetical protein DICPUDRAFT_52102 [Dictyostelium purpureum]
MKDSENNKEEEVSGEPIVIGSGRVVLPAGTPDFKPDKNAGKKLLQAHYQVQEKEEKNRQQQQQGTNQSKEESDEEPEKPTAKAAKGKGGKSSSKYTPLEQQFLAIKKDNPDTVLMVECGYKYKFFGDDAEIANKVLNIYSYVAKNFLNASIPCQRLYFHLRRLVLAGYKVGVVEQTETAALKAISSSKSQPFERKLTRIYTSSTFIDDEVDDSLQNSSPQYLVSFYEASTSASGTNSSDNTTPSVETISFVAVSIRTGEIIYDTFKDSIMRSQLETALTHLKPSEILMPPSVLKKEKSNTSSGYKFSDLTYKCLKSYSKCNSARTQNMDNQIFDYDVALMKLQEFYDNNNCSQVLDHIKSIMNKYQIICLGVLLSYLDQFIHFGSILKVPSNFKAFRTANHLVLPHSTITNLELLTNESDNSEKGSLIWLMNRTSTFSGRRMFTNWLCKPLNQLDSIKERQSAVEELVEGIKVNSNQVASITALFKSHIPDLQRNLSRVYYKNQCTPKEFLNTMSSLKRILELFKEISKGYTFKSNLLNQIFKIKTNSDDDNQDDKLSERINYFLSNLNHDAAKDYSSVNCEKSDLWLDFEKYPKILETKKRIKVIEEEFKKILKEIRYELKKPSLEYLHMPKLNLEYLVELPPKFAGVPKTWIKVSSTQKAIRYHPPEILEQLKLLSQCRETLKIQAQESWISFLGEFTLDYSLFSNFVHKISNLDCLFSLAKISCMDGYVKPEFTSEPGIQVVEGRHPVVEVLLNGTYVPNSVKLSSNKERAMIITGPNMGGKSSFIRQTSLIVIMAQMGCFVPAKECKLGVFDAIYTRMGAHDNIEKGSSTFFIELQETSEILKHATPNSLVILDELGRGTSTHDGVALAYSTLKFIVDEKKCFCLFVTHYPLLAQLESMYPNIIGNYHMGFIEKKVESDSENFIPKVIFLYQLVQGAAQNSYGLNVANMAGLPNEILKIASIKSNEMKETITKRANLVNNSNDNEKQKIEDEIKQTIKTWVQNSNSLSKDQLNQLVEKLKSLQLKV